MELKKGDIVLVQAPANPSGTEIQKTRTAVVVSPKEMAIHGNRAIVIPITSNVSKIYPFEFLIKSKYLYRLGFVYSTQPTQLNYRSCGSPVSMLCR